MPRTGGVYSPPAGTKGTPNTTIQSVPYNTLIDDLTADANTARPVTAGGTGATSASGARTALGVEIGTNVQAYDAGLQSIAGLTTVANQMLYTTGTDLYATTALTPFARTLLDDADAAAMKATLGLAAVASSGSASDITTGTLADGRLPSSMAGKTFTSTVAINSGNLNVGSAVYQSDGNIQFAGSMPAVVGYTTLANAIVGKANLSGAVFTGDVFAQALVANSSAYIRSAGDRYVRFQTAANVDRGVVVHNNAAGAIQIQLMNTSGTFQYAQSFFDVGVSGWDGHSSRVGGGISTSDVTWFTNNTGHSYRIIAVNDGTGALQRSSDRFTANASSIMTWSGTQATFPSSVTMNSALTLNGANNGIELGAGSSNTPFIDFHSGSTPIDYDARIIASGGTGSPGGGTLTFSGNMVFNTAIQVGSSFHFTDGNLQFAGGMAAYGTYLSDALSARAVIYTGTVAGETNFTIGHHVLAYHTTAPVNNSTVNVWTATSNFGYTYSTNAVSLLSGTWRQRGGLQYSSGNYVNLAQRVA